MSEDHQTIESTGADVEAAITKGLDVLGIGRDEAVVEVLDSGSRGILGIGAREARVRLTHAVQAPVHPQVEVAQAPVATAPAAEAPRPPAAPVTVGVSTDEESTEPEAAEAAPSEEQVGPAVLEELLQKMGLKAKVDLQHPSRSEEEGPSPLVFDVRGSDLDVLVGSRGQVLDALQHIARLIVGHEIGRRVSFVVDVNGHRVRRERSLRQLAERMAAQVIRTGRTVALEPMSPAERRIVHVALRNHAGVKTESVGEGERRKVTIIPTKNP